MFFYIRNRKPREEETKAEPILYPNSNPMIAFELLVPVLKYKTWGTTGCLFLSEYNSGVLIYWSPVPDPSERNLASGLLRNNSHGKTYPADGTIYHNSFFPKTTIEWNFLPYSNLHEIYRHI